MADQGFVQVCVAGVHHAVEFGSLPAQSDVGPNAEGCGNREEGVVPDSTETSSLAQAMLYSELISSGISKMLSENPTYLGERQMRDSWRFDLLALN